VFWQVQAAHHDPHVRFIDTASQNTIAGHPGGLWIKPLADGSVAAAFVNFESKRTVTLEAPHASFGARLQGCGLAADEWLEASGASLPPARTSAAAQTFQVEVPPQDVRLFHFSGSARGLK
jgi:hypothetical protein